MSLISTQYCKGIDMENKREKKTAKQSYIYFLLGRSTIGLEILKSIFVLHLFMLDD